MAPMPFPGRAACTAARERTDPPPLGKADRGGDRFLVGVLARSLGIRLLDTGGPKASVSRRLP